MSKLPFLLIVLYLSLLNTLSFGQEVKKHTLYTATHTDYAGWKPSITTATISLNYKGTKSAKIETLGKVFLLEYASYFEKDSAPPMGAYQRVMVKVNGAVEHSSFIIYDDPEMGFQLVTSTVTYLWHNSEKIHKEFSK